MAAKYTPLSEADLDEAEKELQATIDSNRRKIERKIRDYVVAHDHEEVAQVSGGLVIVVEQYLKDPAGVLAKLTSGGSGGQTGQSGSKPAGEDKQPKKTAVKPTVAAPSATEASRPTKMGFKRWFS